MNHAQCLLKSLQTARLVNCGAGALGLPGFAPGQHTHAATPRGRAPFCLAARSSNRSMAPLASALAAPADSRAAAPAAKPERTWGLAAGRRRAGERCLEACVLLAARCRCCDRVAALPAAVDRGRWTWRATRLLRRCCCCCCTRRRRCCSCAHARALLWPRRPLSPRGGTPRRRGPPRRTCKGVACALGGPMGGAG